MSLLSYTMGKFSDLEFESIDVGRIFGGLDSRCR